MKQAIENCPIRSLQYYEYYILLLMYRGMILYKIYSKIDVDLIISPLDHRLSLFLFHETLLGWFLT